MSELHFAVNHKIRSRIVRLIMDGKPLGIVPIAAALQKAQECGLDLVEVAPTEKPPVCRIMDYGKFQYEIKKRTKGKKPSTIELKEIRFSPVTGDHDIETKLKQLRGFLAQGKHVKVTVRFKGRQLAHMDQGRQIMKKVIGGLEDIGKIENSEKLDGKDLSVRIVPR